MVSVKNLANCDENYEYEKVVFLYIERHFYRSKVNTAKNVKGKKTIVNRAQFGPPRRLTLKILGQTYRTRIQRFSTKTVMVK